MFAVVTQPSFCRPILKAEFVAIVAAAYPELTAISNISSQLGQPLTALPDVLVSQTTHILEKHNAGKELVRSHDESIRDMAAQMLAQRTSTTRSAL